jgi:Tfp pilus assembly protein PilF
MFTNLPVVNSWKILFFLYLLLFAFNQTLFARECTPSVAWAISIQGRVEAKSFDETLWRAVRQGDHFCPGDNLRVGRNSRAGLILHNESLLRLAENSAVRFNAPTEEGNFFLGLLNGVGHIISRFRRPYQVNTPYINAHVEGTEFTIESHPDSVRVTVLEGQVVAYNDYGEVTVTDGQRAECLPYEAPRSGIVANPRDAVQWALYYPPVIEPPSEPASEALRRSLAANRIGDLNNAFDALAEESGIENDVDLLVYRASLHLQVGSIEAAKRDLSEVLHQQPEQADALALMSLIATANSKSRQAIDLARRAVSSDDQSAPANLALSYALQARFQLSEAREAAEQATMVAPQNPLAWARLAYLELMFRNLDASTEAASRAVAIAPEHAQIQTTRGFVRLIQFDLEGAQQAFELAASLDQAAPLPRLGLGLVRIRKGDIEAGRRQLEIAVNLDPGNALIRSYLGKAYYEEKHDTSAATQFTLAKQFDELDPTPWFYDAIRKQADNRPIEALQDIQTSIDLNDNRAVYRSRLLLDQDEAARGASQGRIYQDLGFDQLAQTEAYKSLQSSAHNHSAHRLLADSYIGRPRYERALLSELLQSQLLQPLNTTPIQPQLVVSNLGILDGVGPTDGGFAEYTPLFTREGLDLQLNLIGGNNSTWGDDLILSGLRGKMSFSLGQFLYDTDGWRENNDLKHEIYNAFLQYSIAPSTHIQFEYRQQDAISGDLGLRFEPEIFSPISRDDLKQRFGRVGVHHQFTPDSHLIASAFYQDTLKTRKENESQFVTTNIPPYGDLSGTYIARDIVTYDSIASALESQFSQRLHSHTITIGAGYYDEDFSESESTSGELFFPLPESSEVLVVPVEEPSSTKNTVDPRFKNAYIYSLFALPGDVSFTIGAAFEDFESAYVEKDKISAKLGLSWDIAENVALRTAFLQNLARPLRFVQTIEQTQVAGFNQFFDDVQGAEIRQSAIGIDTELKNGLFIGAEYYRRDLEVPQRDVIVPMDENVDDEVMQSYIYWTATDRLAVRASYKKEKLKRELDIAPKALSTQQIPVGISYHWPSGMFADIEGNRIKQKITRNGITEQSDFWNVDMILGYRIRSGFGKAEFVVKNVLNEEFNFYDLSFHTNENLLPQFQPERQFFFRFSSSF